VMFNGGKVEAAGIEPAASKCGPGPPETRKHDRFGDLHKSRAAATRFAHMTSGNHTKQVYRTSSSEGARQNLMASSRRLVVWAPSRVTRIPQTPRGRALTQRPETE
jgi:hypothetical protein